MLPMAPAGSVVHRIVDQSGLIAFLASNGYENVRALHNGTIVGTCDLMFTRSVCVGLNWDSWEARYCYEDRALATRAALAMSTDDEPPLAGYIATRGNAVNQIFSADQARRIDAAMVADKQRDGYASRHDAIAMDLQVKYQSNTGVTL